jgi:hypothetical protein
VGEDGELNDYRADRRDVRAQPPTGKEQEPVVVKTEESMVVSADSDDSSEFAVRCANQRGKSHCLSADS